MLAAIRIRGEVKLRKDLRETLEILGLYRLHQLILRPKNRSMEFMLKKIEPYITYGEIDQETLAELLEKRGRLLGEKHLDQAFLKKHGSDSFQALAKKLLEQKASLHELGIKKVFRLHAPRKGFERQGIKKMFSIGGAAGYRAAKINELIKRMM
jgi:large subunit ribosomal protein L30